MTNAQLFLDLYNELDHLFAKSLNLSDYLPFRDKVRELSSRNSIVKRYQDDLILFGNLRNAIAHRTKGGIPIAEPFDDTVRLLQKILEEFKNPKKVIPTFQIEVFTVIANTSLIDLLQEMKDKNFSQAPILDNEGNVTEVISTNTISRWLFSEYKNQLIDLTVTKISDLIPKIEIQQNFALISRNTTIFEAAEIYIRKSKEKKSQLDCLLITQNGKPTEKIIGIACIEDLAPYLI